MNNETEYRLMTQGDIVIAEDLLTHATAHGKTVTEALGKLYPNKRISKESA